MNPVDTLIAQMRYDSDKPYSVTVRKTDGMRQIAFGLTMQMKIRKHITAVPATVMVLKGSVNISFEDREVLLSEFDTFEIPVNEPHEVTGIQQQNIFVLTQEI